MGDAALSQNEIDSLLQGFDSGPPPAPKGGGGSTGSASPEAAAFKGVLESCASALSQVMSTFTNSSATVGSPVVDVINRDGLLRELPEEIMAGSVPFEGSFPGEHLFLMPKDLAIAIASQANGDQGLMDLDDMSINALQECVSQLTGSEINTFSSKTSNQGIASGVAEGSFGPKAMARVPSGEMMRATWSVKIGNEAPMRMVEIFSMTFARDIIAASGGGQSQGGNSFGGMGGGMGGGMQSMGQGQSFGGGGGDGGFPMGGGGGGGGGMGFGGGGYGQQMNPPNVQPVQFGSLQMGSTSHESGNIGLIMDVQMEMTVELGRTRKLIKEILGMGEGTIIELDKLAGEPVDILVNHKLIAKGEVVVIDENFGVRVTEIVSTIERMSDLG
jgi:flagellar motor switch protein FliN/FliY